MRPVLIFLNQIRSLKEAYRTKMSTAVSDASRGALVVVEGIDRAGKTTQCHMLVEKLKRIGLKAEYLNFPARHTQIGQVINDYLTSKHDLPDEAIHLLFSANRWECSRELKTKLAGGTTLIIDRYCYSGVAFSAAKGLDINWCKRSDSGLPRPDKVFFLTVPTDRLLSRDGFGNERYEIPKFQGQVLKKFMELKEDNWEMVNADRQVLKKFMELKEDNWEMVNADRSIEELNNELFERIKKAISSSENTSLGKIWQNQN